MKNKVIQAVFNGAHYFSVICIGLILCLMVEYGVCFDTIVGLVVTVFNAIAYKKVGKKYGEQ